MSSDFPVLDVHHRGANAFRALFGVASALSVGAKRAVLAEKPGRLLGLAS